MSKPSAPPPPDFTGAAQATGQSNIQAAIANAIMSHANFNTPWGSMNWGTTPTSTGGTGSPGAPGAPNEGGRTGFGGIASLIPTPSGGSLGTSGIPQFTGNVNLTPEQQAIFNTQQGTQGTMANATQKLAGNIATGPLDLSGMPPMPAGGDQTSQLKNVQDALFARQSQYLDPQFEKGQNVLNQQLADQGFQVGDAGVSNPSGTGAQDAFNMAKQKAYADARDSAIIGSSGQLAQNTATALSQRQQAISEALAQRDQPLTELAALRGGSQVGMPQFPGAPGSQGIPGSNFLGAAEAQNQAGLQNFGIQAGMYNSQMGGLMGLGGLGALLAFM